MKNTTLYIFGLAWFVLVAWVSSLSDQEAMTAPGQKASLRFIFTITSYENMQCKCSHFGGPQSWVFKISLLALLERPSTFEDWIGCHSKSLPWSQLPASATGELWWSQLGAPPTSPEKQGVSERIVGKIIRTMKCVQEESRASVQACRGGTNA